MKAYVVDKALFADNIRRIVEFAGNAAVYGVVKGDGYGIGLLRVASALRAQGVTRFAVTEIDEVRALRNAGFESEEILMLRATCLQDELQALLDLNAVATVSSTECAHAMQRVAEECGKRFSCHIKIDTGMGRYGFHPDEIDSICSVYELSSLAPCGIYTHFHSAFGDSPVTREQFRTFSDVCNALTSRGIQLGIRHCCNSSAFLKYPDMHMDAVRIGSALLGRLSFPDQIGLQRIGWCRAQVEELRTIPAGHSVGYSAGWVAKRETRIAVFGVGYFHGFGTEHADDVFQFRDCLRGGLYYLKAFLKHRAYYVEINGKPARVLGHIGMVQTICDVTDLPCQVGDPIRIEINPLMLKGLEFTDS